MAPGEKTMKYLPAVLFLASCAMLNPLPVDDRSSGQPAAVETPENQQEARKPKSKPGPPAAPAPVSSCANLDAGDLKETIKAKLDCITEHAK
jgi:hypothetical protein